MREMEDEQEDDDEVTLGMMMGQQNLNVMGEGAPLKRRRMGGEPAAGIATVDCGKVAFLKQDVSKACKLTISSSAIEQQQRFARLFAPVVVARPRDKEANTPRTPPGLPQGLPADVKNEAAELLLGLMGPPNRKHGADGAAEPQARGDERQQVVARLERRDQQRRAPGEQPLLLLQAPTVLRRLRPLHCDPWGAWVGPLPPLQVL